MTVKSITSAILDDAKEQAASFTEEATKEAEKLLAEEEQRLEQEREAREAAIAKEAEKVYSTEMVKANFKLRNEELKVRRTVIEESFSLALSTIGKQKDSDRKQFLQKLLKKANDQLDVKTVWVNSKDKSFIPKKYDVQTKQIVGGLIAASKNGTILLDLSYEALLAEIKETKVELLASRLEA